jgi:hypothetical protein
VIVYDVEAGTDIELQDSKNACRCTDGGWSIPIYRPIKVESFNTPVECAGDFNGDGVVNGADFGSMLAAWGACSCCPQDLNGDGGVTGADVGLLLTMWGDCP